MTLREPIRGGEAVIFDLDGTLTVAVHDFDAIRRELGLPPTRPILEALDALGDELAAPLRARLEEIEFALAERARAATGAEALLRALAEAGTRVGIVTRNAKAIALRSLEVAGLAWAFGADEIFGRDEARPKPDPQALHRQLERWSTAPERAVMIGDSRFDVEAGRRAGLRTVLVGSDAHPAAGTADLHVGALDELFEARPGRAGSHRAS